jgi:hypothetical protein
MSMQENHPDRLPTRISARKRSGLYLESTEAEQLGIPSARVHQSEGAMMLVSPGTTTPLRPTMQPK